MVTFLFPILRQTMLAVLLTLCVLSRAQAVTGPSEDKVFPAYRVDAAGCTKLNAGGPYTVTLDPSPFKDSLPTQVTALIVPDTPVFFFFENNLMTFYRTPFSQFDPSMQCFTEAVYGSDKLLHFAGMSPGKYIVVERTSLLVTYSGETENTEYATVSNLVSDGQGGVTTETKSVPYTTYTPYTRQYERIRLYGAFLTISPNGHWIMTAPTLLAGEGD